MLRTLSLFALLAASAAAQTAMIPAGVAAAHMIGRLVMNPDGTAELVGYYPHLEGIPGALFATGADPSERNAHFTFRSSRFRVALLRNEPLTHLRTSPAEGSGIILRVYFNAEPANDFLRPATFSAGTLIAQYQSRGTNTTIIPFTTTVNTGSFSRLTTADFVFHDRTYNLGRLAENITVQLHGAPLDLALGFLNASVPFGGTALAAAPNVTDAPSAAQPE